MRFLEILRQRRRRIRRHLEAVRLKRIRRHTQPGYTHCMNCGTPLKGMYCHRCGQYALDIYQPIWKYIRQYFENMYQFDGKIWLTLRLLFTRPGYLTNEFNEGKINSYVHPFRLYMCISVVFFTLFFMGAERETSRALLVLAGEQIPDSIVDTLKQADPATLPDTTVYAYNTQTLRNTLLARGVEQTDGLLHLHYGEQGNELNEVTLPTVLFRACMTRTALHQDDEQTVASLRRLDKNGYLDDDELLYLSLPTDTTTGRITANVYDWMTRIDQAATLHHQATASFVLGQLSKWTPFYLMFLLPLQALIFKLFYHRRRYMEHFAHATHLGSFLLILIAIPAGLLLKYLAQGGGMDILIPSFAASLFWICPLLILLYQLVSMHTVYRQGWGKTLVKWLLSTALFSLISLGIAVGLLLQLVYSALGK